ncbi:unnamed protein product [Cylindrotheca closterium]|uniref:Uncharacterized protein n=1 Tax=Cylindrotheca closterium TaxID=2856 RepID=A0AAD2FHJ2_9STRA|nr:unnamed protein product [Cylindrotheca closterium]
MTKSSHYAATTMLMFLMALLSLSAQAQPDDIFHCRDPKEVDKKTQLKCEKDSFEWKLDDLEADQPPEICGPAYIAVGQPQTMPAPGETPDELEPCLLWSIFYGSLVTDVPTISPTSLASATPSAPTDPPTTEDGEDGGIFNPPTLAPVDGADTIAPVVPTMAPTLAPVVPTNPPTGLPSASPTVTDPTRLRVEAFTLTYAFNRNLDFNIFNGPDRLELYDITLQHFETSLRAELNGVPIDKIELNMQTAITAGGPLTSPAQQQGSPGGGGGKTWTELVSGFVQFGIPAPIESSTLQTLVSGTFSGNALDVYEFRLQLANDDILKQIAKVSMGLEGIDASNDDNEDAIDGGGGTTNSDDGLTWSPLLIAIVACVVIGVIMACVFAYFLLYGRRRRRRSRQAKAQEEYVTRDIPELQTDPTPPSDDAGLEYSAEDYQKQNDFEQQQEHIEQPRYPSTLPTPDGVMIDADHNLHEPYLLNPVESDAGSSLRNDGDTFYDMENQSLAPSLYSYREEMSILPGGDKQQQAPAAVAPPYTTLDSVPTQLSSLEQPVSERGSPSKKSNTSAAVAGGLLGGIVGKYIGNNKKKNQSALGGDDASSSEDEYGFEKEANPSNDDASLLKNVDDASLLKVDTANSNQSVTGNSTSPSYIMDDRSLISDGRVGQILGDVHSIQGQESTQNFDDIWNDDDSDDDDGIKSSKSTITDPDGTEQNVHDVLNSSGSSKPFDEPKEGATTERPFDEERIEQRDIVIPDIPARNMALVNSQQETARFSNNSNSDRNNNQMLGPLDDDEVSQLGDEVDLLPPELLVRDDEELVEPEPPVVEDPAVKNIKASPFAENETVAEKAPVEDESVEDYDHHHKIPDDSTYEGSSMLTEERSIAEDSYGFVDQKFYKPSVPTKPVSTSSEDVKLALPQNLKQERGVVDSVPNGDVVLASSGSGDDQSIEAVSVGAVSTEATPVAATPVEPADKGTKKSGLTSNIKSLASKPRQLVKGMSVRKKKNSDWTMPSKEERPPRSVSPTPSQGSTDSAKFRALMNEPNVFDTPNSTPDQTTPKEAVEDTKRTTPAPLLQRMPSDSDEDDCYLDEPVIPYPAGVLPKTSYEEKKDDGSVEFSLDEVAA